AYAKLASAGTWLIRTIATSGQPSSATTRYSSPTATEFTTCSALSICAADFCELFDSRSSFLLDGRHQTFNVRCLSYANISTILNRSSWNQKTAQRQGARSVRSRRDITLCCHRSNLRV